MLSLTLVGWGLLGCRASGVDTQPVPQHVEQVSAQPNEPVAKVKQSSAREPKRAFLLAQQASERAGRGDYAGALIDLDAAIEIRGNVPELSLMHCMLSERESKQPQLDCYANVVRAYEVNGALCESNLNCVVAASMASSLKAPRYRAQYLEAPKSPEEQGLAETVLKDFTREGYLHTILP
ncbi:hypothetical protein [Ralstonia sp. UBA689]|uniref:hypothetical protein n=1 Tax=Ralstonia sp. UBA689 TaxID=1947373 RepID=UPI0025CFFBD9|nr:hypothetical protein [Ralstonia sp. UBA689]